MQVSVFPFRLPTIRPSPEREHEELDDEREGLRERDSSSISWTAYSPSSWRTSSIPIASTASRDRIRKAATLDELNVAQVASETTLRAGGGAAPSASSCSAARRLRRRSLRREEDDDALLPASRAGWRPWPWAGRMRESPSSESTSTPGRRTSECGAIVDEEAAPDEGAFGRNIATPNDPTPWPPTLSWPMTTLCGW